MYHLYLEITERCNLHCLHCYNSSSSTGLDLQPSVFFKLLNEICHAPEEWSLSFSGGEPLLHPHFFEFLDSTLKNQIPTSLVTNGLLLNKIPQKYFFGKTPLKLQISLDAMTPEIDNEIRGGNHFNNVIDIIKNLHHCGYKLGRLKMTINSLNYSHIEKFVDFSLENDFLPVLSFLTKSGNAISNWDRLVLSEKKKASLIQDMEKIFKLREPQLHSMSKDLNIENLYPHIEFKCDLLNPTVDINAAIKPSGEVQPCQGLYDQLFCIGNICETSIYYILDRNQNPRFRTLLELLETRKNFLLSSMCKSCPLRLVCGTGCPVRALEDTKNLISVDNNCAIRKEHMFSQIFKHNLKQDSFSL
mgnify:CR=1 FL=1